MRADLLLELADFLDQLYRTKPARFNFGTWVGNDWQGHPDLSCGTTACAWGWATTLWPDRLQLQQVFYGADIAPVVCVDGKIRSMLEGAEEFFELDYLDARFLFMPSVNRSNYDWTSPPATATAADVAEHIRRFVNLYKERRHAG